MTQLRKFLCQHSYYPSKNFPKIRAYKNIVWTGKLEPCAILLLMTYNCFLMEKIKIKFMLWLSRLNLKKSRSLTSNSLFMIEPCENSCLYRKYYFHVSDFQNGLENALLPEKTPSSIIFMQTTWSFCSFSDGLRKCQWKEPMVLLPFDHLRVRQVPIEKNHSTLVGQSPGMGIRRALSESYIF